MPDDADRIDQIYVSMRAKLGRAVRGIVPPKDVEDIVQETYVRVCQVENKDGIKKPQSFLYRTARNLALDHVKRAESQLAISVEEFGEIDAAASGRANDATFEQVVSNEEFAWFCEAVRELPMQCRRAFVLRKVYGYSQREIARVMEISESTVEKHISQGIKRCTYWLVQNGDERMVGADSPRPERRNQRLNIGGVDDK